VRALLAFAVGCSSNSPAQIDAAVIVDAPAACTAIFSGNFVETVTSDTPCALFGDDAMFHVTVTTTSLVDPYSIALDVPALVGDASSQTTATWSSMAMRMLAHDGCILAAGNQVVPHGDFTLHLDSATPAHGTLAVDQPVHATEFSNCGSPLLEHVEVMF
jgi:hypothetical protein